MTERPALLLDLDGTLTDSVYQHAIAWRKALELGGIKLSVWRIHRRIGMSGGLLAESLARETGRELSEKQARQVKQAHARLFKAQMRDVRLLPGAKELMQHLTKLKVPWAIATSGARISAQPLLKLVEPPDGVPIISRDDVEHAKPDPARRSEAVFVDCDGRVANEILTNRTGLAADPPAGMTQLAVDQPAGWIRRVGGGLRGRAHGHKAALRRF